MKKQKNNTHTFFQKAGHIMWIIFLTLLGLCLIFVAALVISSPGKLKPFVDENGNPLAGSLSEKVFVDINGVKQGMFIQSKDTSNPVLLYLHGGMPDYFLSKKYPTGLDEMFTVVWWEQRGSGMSYDPSIPRESMNMEQMIDDTLEVTNYLRQRFGKEKIYIMGHSGGTFIGIQAAARAPELYYAYMGEAQMSYQLKSEKIAYDYMLEQYKVNGDTRMVEKLEASPVSMSTGTPLGYIQLRDPAMHSLGIGTMHEMNSVITGIFLPSLFVPEYTLKEKINMWRAKSQAGVSIVWQDMLATDLAVEVPELTIPVYFFHGIYDYTCSYTLSKDYFESLEAPLKGFYTFENSAHSPMFEEPERFQQIMREDVLSLKNSLAD